MADGLIINGLQYLGYAVELGLLVLLVRRGRGMRYLCVYVGALLIVDSVTRPVLLHRYGFHSPQYYSAYWSTDALLTLLTFFLVYTFFRRAFSWDAGAWASARPVRWAVLSLVTILEIGLSFFALKQNHGGFSRLFLVTFNQYLYFAGAVLNTALYLRLVRRPDSDRQLQLLVCGLGIQYAGAAAGFALVQLGKYRPGVAVLLNSYSAPLCTLAMLGVWAYAMLCLSHPAGPSQVRERVRIPAPV